MHDLLTFQPSDLKSNEYNPRIGEQRALAAEIEAAPTLADVIRIARIEDEGGRAKWSGAAPDPYWDMGWGYCSTPASSLVHAARVLLQARAYAEALPSLRSPERRARVFEVVANCARAIESRATYLSAERRKALADEVRALVE